MSNIFMYAHGGSGNHGCEAIVRSTVKILNNKNMTLISMCPQEDKKYGLEELCEIINDTNEINKKSLDFVKAYLSLKVKKDYIPLEKLRYKTAFSHIKKGDITLSIGGDNYCYADVEKYVMFHDMLKKRGAKTILWGCSVEPDVAAKPEIAKDLSRFDLITARETITYEALKKINPNTMLVSDPAFQLDCKKTELPTNFIDGNTIGINLSPMAIENETVKGIAKKNYTALIDYIIDKTDMNIAFIPHVVWQDGDDRVPLNEFYENYKSTGRVCIVGDMSCNKLKYIISKCRFFVGARTHATIAAYSTCVPTLVVGYSVKAKGIARDIFGDETNYVIPVQSLCEKNDLLCAFKWIERNHSEIKNHLRKVMPGYIGRAYSTGKFWT